MEWIRLQIRSTPIQIDHWSFRPLRGHEIQTREIHGDSDVNIRGLTAVNGESCLYHNDLLIVFFYVDDPVAILSNWIGLPYHYRTTVDPDRIYVLCLSCLLTYDWMSHRMSHYLFLLPIWLSFLNLPDVYRELLEPSLIDRVLILDCPFNRSAAERTYQSFNSSRKSW